MFVEFPKWRFHPTLPARIVANADEEKALGPGWGDSPAVSLPAAPKVEAPPATPTDARAAAVWRDAPEAIISTIATITDPSMLEFLLGIEKSNPAKPRKDVTKAIYARIRSLRKVEAEA